MSTGKGDVFGHFLPQFKKFLNILWLFFGQKNVVFLWWCGVDTPMSCVFGGHRWWVHLPDSWARLRPAEVGN